MHFSDYIPYLERIGSRYFYTAGFAFILFYWILNGRLGLNKIQSKFPKQKDYIREIGYSILTILIFSFVPLFILHNPSIRIHTWFYTNMHDYGRVYFFLAFPIMFILHDTYFYWTHRLMHHKKLFRIFHKVHHLSTNPSPWTAFAFHPFEAVVETGIFPVFLFLMPIHPLHLFIFFLVMIVYNVYGHLGYELYPRGFNTSLVGRWINTSVNHNQHHQYFKGNYGLYFTWWDKLMGTIRADYDRRFEEVKTSKKQFTDAAIVCSKNETIKKP